MLGMDSNGTTIVIGDYSLDRNALYIEITDRIRSCEGRDQRINRRLAGIELEWVWLLCDGVQPLM